jgi:DNA repair protein RadC
MILKEVNQNERPREKARKEGIDQLSNSELLAILLRTGSIQENALELAQRILFSYPNLATFRETTLEELTQIKGIGNAKALSILSAIELGRRLATSGVVVHELSSADEVAQYMKPYFEGQKQEKLYSLYFDVKGNLQHVQLLSIGTVSSTLIDSKTIFKWAYKYSSSAFILVHNHPSGDETPSQADIRMTKQVRKEASVLNLSFLDHIVVGNHYYSMKENFVFDGSMV